MAQHTPGPWKVRGYRTKEGSIWIDSDAWAGTKRIAGTVAAVYATGTGSDDPAVQEANAQLISRAPSMKLALEAIAAMEVGPVTDWPEMVALLIAIAKVELEKLPS